MALKVNLFVVLVFVIIISVKGMIESDVIPKVLSTRNLMELTAPISQNIPNQRCRNHSEIYLRDLKLLKLWAAESE